jgi:hypothetical protein
MDHIMRMYFTSLQLAHKLLLSTCLNCATAFICPLVTILQGVCNWGRLQDLLGQLVENGGDILLIPIVMLFGQLEVRSLLEKRSTLWNALIRIGSRHIM